MTGAAEMLELLDWKSRISDLYREIRASSNPKPAWDRWRIARDEMFATHPQSPLPSAARAEFSGLAYYPYNPRMRLLAETSDADPEHFEIGTSGGGSYGFTRFATARFEVAGSVLALDLYWLDGYAGGLFLPFRDATAGKETYGAGRYLLDTVKGADLGTEDGRLILDFNFAYNPSCAYDPRWVCPLAPPPNHLPVAVRTGEKHPG